VYYAHPTQSFGYYRGWPIFGHADDSGQGVDMAGNSVFSAGSGPSKSAGESAWTPTILYLFVLIIIEMFVFAFIARRL
jgi:hypothetical protein